MEIQPRRRLGGHILCCVLAAGAGRIEIEITHICQPRSIVAHRQYGIDLTPLRLNLRAAGDRLGHQTDVVPLLPREGQRRRTQHNARWKEHAAAHFICRAVLEERQPLRAIHRRQIELDTGLIGQRRVPFAVSGKDRSIQRQLMIEQPAAVNMILRPDGAGQVEAAQAAGDVNFDRKGFAGGLTDWRR